MYGLLLCEAGQFEEAERILNPLVKADPENLRAVLAASVCGQLTFVKDRKKGLKINLMTTNFWKNYKQIYRYAPETPALWNNLGLIFVEKDLYAALFSLKRASYLSPLNTTILYNIGLIYFKLNQFVHASQTFQAIRQIQETQDKPKIEKTDKLAIYSSMMLALSLWKCNDLKNAKKIFTEALKFCGKDPWICTNFALFQLENGDRQSAFDVVSQWFSDEDIARDPGVQIECLRKMVRSLEST